MRSTEERKTLLLSAAQAAVRAVDPGAAVRRWLQSDDGVAWGTGRDSAGVTIVAVGKAAPAMARAAVEVLGEDVDAALVVSDHTEPLPDSVELIVGGHPIPTAASVAAGRRALSVVGAASDVLFLISGGGSALLELPADGVTLEDVADLTERLLRCGAPIEEINTVRTQLSIVKGGGLGAAAPAGHATLALSDVIGSPPQAIASGPTVAAASSAGDAMAVLERRGIASELPGAVLAQLERGEPKPLPTSGSFHVVGDGSVAAAAASAHLVDSGCEATVLSTEVQGEARDVALWAHQLVRHGTVGVFAGETTVTVTGGGRGGRNQEAALALSGAISGSKDVAVFLGTDGIDGPTDAAGAIVDGRSHGAMLDAGVDPRAALADNDAHHALDVIGALIRTGATGTNVGDLWLISRS